MSPRAYNRCGLSGFAVPVAAGDSPAPARLHPEIEPPLPATDPHRPAPPRDRTCRRERDDMLGIDAGITLAGQSE